MHKLCANYALYALIMQKLRSNYAHYARQKLRKIRQNYAKKLRKNYAYVCKLHNLHYYAAHFADGPAWQNRVVDLRSRSMARAAVANFNDKLTEHSQRIPKATLISRLFSRFCRTCNPHLSPSL